MTTLVTAAQIAQLRRMVAEPTSATYTDELLTTYIENHALLDEQNEDPYYLSSDTPPVRTLNPDWMPTYDLNAAAADIWEEKTALVAGNSEYIHFSSDGSSFSRDQFVDHCSERARYYRMRASSKTATLHKWPKENTNALFPWIVNLPEND